MLRLFLIILVDFILRTLLWGENWNTVNSVSDTAIKPILLEDFEKKTDWIASCVYSDGIAGNSVNDVYPVIKFMEGGPEDVKDKPGNQKTILGIKITCKNMGEYWIRISPKKPVFIKNFIRSVSFWILSRNYLHKIVPVFLDKNGQSLTEYFTPEKMNWMDWKQLTYQLSMETHDGLFFNGFRIFLDPLQTITDSYLYIDSITAEIEEIRGEK